MHRSITTVVISSIEFSIVDENLLKNGDFEDVGDSSWKSNSSSSSATSFPWRGERHGELNKLGNWGESLLSQTITISGEGSSQRLENIFKISKRFINGIISL
jgi:hypothetical protein